jgi:Repeat of unknown function (DUF5907)
MPSTFTLERVESGKIFSITSFNTDLDKIQVAIRALQDATSGSGTVSSVGRVATELAQIFTLTITDPTTTPLLTFNAVTKAANLVYASPTTGSAAAPTFRSLVLADLPTITPLKGGNGLTALGTAYQITRVNSAGTANEWTSLLGGSTKLSITPNAGNISFDVVPANIPINGLDTSTKLSIANGGTGSETQQAAINALTAASSGTVAHVLKLDGSKNAIWAAETVGISNINGQTGASVTLTTDNINEGATNLYFTTSRSNSAFDIRLATKTTDNLSEGSTNKYNASHSGDVTGATVLTIANTAVTYAKMQNISATKRLLGRVTTGAGVTEEISAAGNLAFNSTSIISKLSLIRTVTSTGSIAATDGTVLVNASGTTQTLPDTSTIAIGDDFILKSIAGAANNTITVFSTGTESIDGATTYNLQHAFNSVVLKYAGSGRFYIISEITSA